MKNKKKLLKKGSEFEIFFQDYFSKSLIRKAFATSRTRHIKLFMHITDMKKWIAYHNSKLNIVYSQSNSRIEHYGRI